MQWNHSELEYEYPTHPCNYVDREGSVLPDHLAFFNPSTMASLASKMCSNCVREHRK